MIKRILGIVALVLAALFALVPSPLVAVASLAVIVSIAALPGNRLKQVLRIAGSTFVQSALNLIAIASGMYPVFERTVIVPFKGRLKQVALTGI